MKPDHGADRPIKATRVSHFLRSISLNAKVSKAVVAYGLAGLLPILTLYLRLRILVDFGERPLLILFMLPIVCVALAGGMGPGLVATLVTALLTGYFMIPPIGSFGFAATHDLFQWGLLIVNGLLVSAASGMLYRIRQEESMRRQQLESALSLSRRHQELLSRSKERQRHLAT
ncbi:MAG: DUF4118 domain-containing protein, partial [Methylomonas sp.]|nr:DUF4118 domain-containing protein [Methylomonas sp.]